MLFLVNHYSLFLLYVQKQEHQIPEDLDRSERTKQPHIFINIQGEYCMSSMTRLSACQLFFLLILSAISIILPVSSFIVENSNATINTTGDHYVGDKFTITGSTNLAVDNDLLVEIYSSSFKPTQKVQSGEFSGSSGTVTVMPGTNGYNVWSFDVDTATFKPDEYVIRVSGITNEVTASSSFIIRERLPSTSDPTGQGTALQTPFPVTTIPSQLTTQTAGTQSPLAAIVVITGLCVLCIARQMRKI
jgi:hypothetical protein